MPMSIGTREPGDETKLKAAFFLWPEKDQDKPASTFLFPREETVLSRALHPCAEPIHEKRQN